MIDEVVTDEFATSKQHKQKAPVASFVKADQLWCHHHFLPRSATLTGKTHGAC